MKKILLCALAALIFSACNNNAEKQKPDSVTVEQYYTYNKEEQQNAGVKMVPIQTPKGTFRSLYGNHFYTGILLLLFVIGVVLFNRNAIRFLLFSIVIAGRKNQC